MYEVGAWFVYVVDAAILAMVFALAMVAVFIMRGRYQKQARNCIRAEIQMPTGWSQFYVRPCDINAKSVTIDTGKDTGDFVYLLNPERRRYGMHPMNPLMGLSWLQVPIRIETWFQDIPEPMRETYSTIVATSAEIKAMTREVSATTAAMQIQEIEARQDELTKAIGNQPNKIVVYVLLTVSSLTSGLGLWLLYQLYSWLKPVVPA